jgi:DNA-binding response OmpR family regulator
VANRKRVLLVDDEQRMLSALRRALRREPFDLEVAENGTQALERLALDPAIDLVISDYKMPGMSGIDLLTRIRATAPETARILLSGWTSEIPQSEISGAGLSATIGKPWDDAELKASIREALGLH